MLYLKFLHIACMFIAVTLLVGGDLYLLWIARKGDRATLIGFARNADRLESAGVGFIILGIVFGFATALSGGLDLTQPWLLIAYAIAIALFILGPMESAIYAREIKRLEAEGESGGTATAGPIALGNVAVLSLASGVLYVLIIFDMVVKPFS